MKNKKKVFQAFTMVIQFSLNMLVPIVMCTLFGVWLGNKIHAPAIAVLFFFMGAFAGFRNIFIMAKKIYQDDGRDGKR